MKLIKKISDLKKAIQKFDNIGFIPTMGGLHKGHISLIKTSSKKCNKNLVSKHKNIISNPNCSTIQMVLALKPLHDEYKIKRVIVSTYQAVSGAGKASVDELFQQTKDYLNEKKIVSKNFTKQIAFNVIPHIDSFGTDGYTKEELKMINETKKY